MLQRSKMQNKKVAQNTCSITTIESGSGVSSSSISRIVSRDSVYIGMMDDRPVRLKSSSMNSSGIWQKYSWPRGINKYMWTDIPGREQNHEIHDMTDEDEDETADADDWDESSTSELLLLQLSSWSTRNITHDTGTLD
jgi:hypothetical protein